MHSPFACGKPRSNTNRERGIAVARVSEDDTKQGSSKPSDKVFKSSFIGAGYWVVWAE